MIAVREVSIVGFSMIGQTISHNPIAEKLGAGGMGVVYRAEGTNLNRQMAIKVLPDIFSGDPARLARFEREAKPLASLNHPNIAAIHGPEQAEGKRFLVLEPVEGETLAQRIAKRPLPVDEALDVCRQIAEGPEAAHEKGIIHRDLKPAHVKITPEGKVKILDFGLAQASQGDVAAASESMHLRALIRVLQQIWKGVCYAQKILPEADDSSAGFRPGSHPHGTECRRSPATAWGDGASRAV
jgi:serine/threonine protein kinase